MKTCPNCGKEFADNVKFCGECGFSFADAPAPQMNTAPESTVYQGAYEQQPAAGTVYQGAYEQQAPAGKKKKSKRSKLPLIIGAVAAVLVVVVLAVVLIPRLLGGKGSTDFVGAQVAFARERVGFFTESLTKDTLSSDITISATVDGKGEVADMLTDMLDGTSAVVKIDSSSKALLLNAALNLNGSSVLEGFFRLTPDEIGFAVPSADDTYYVGNIADLADTLGIDLSDTQLDISAKEIRNDIEGIVTRYQKVLSASITKDRIETEKNREVKLSEVGKTVTCTVMRWEPEEEELIELFDALADTLEADEQLAGVLEKYGLVEYDYDSGLEMLGDYAEMLRDGAEDLADGIVSSGLVWTVALDKKAQVALIMIEVEYAEIVFERALDGKTGSEAFYVVDDGTDAVMVTNDYTISGSKRTGEIVVDTEYGPFSLAYDIDLSKKSVFGVPYGTYTPDLSDYMPGLGVELAVTGGKSGSTDHVVTVSGLKNLTDDMLRSVNITINTTAKSSAKEPSGKKEDISDYDEYDLTELLEEIGVSVEESLMDSPELADIIDMMGGY